MGTAKEQGVFDLASATLQRRRLGIVLKRAREQAGKTQEDAAAAIDAASSKISRIEQGQSGLKLTDLNVLIDLYGVDEDAAVTMRDLARAGRKRGRWSAYRNVTPNWFRDYLDLEEDALEIRVYESEVVPGILQTEAYIRAVFTTGAPRSVDDELERLISVRMERQSVVDRADVSLGFILSESVLRRVVGNPKLMAGQVRHLARLAERPNIDLQVLPFNAQTFCPASFIFTILRFDHDAATDVVYLEDYTDAVYLDDQEPVRAYNALWHRLSAASLGQVESREMLRRIADEHEHS
ncbi:helix-turn-helix domain-containing protein [Labedaea rhizosphaerae]|uniref:Helix-turn-helix protein n=1 Tax=Labedaea rhizosphaerae TaxID=598644 RepID=A0A4R6SLW7_LABRH|nr:helix-turn-helix transcriptional regulator [Labedaea rhizosphaerae]TDQ04861.1 helix-turn-helix protein [Labedaea rhizosphaerae]